VTRKRSDVYCFAINGGTIAAKVREQPDGSLYVTVGRLSQHLKGKEEARRCEAWAALNEGEL